LYSFCFHLYFFYFHLYPQRIKKYSALQFLRNRHIGKLHFKRYRDMINDIRKRIVCIRLYLFLFVLRRYNVFQFLRNPYLSNLTNFQNIEMGKTERESFVPICIFVTFVSISKDLEIQRFQNFENAPRGKVGHFKRSKWD